MNVKNLKASAHAGPVIAESKAGPGSDHLLHDLRAAIADAQTLTNEAAGATTEHFSDMRGSLENRLTDAKENLVQARAAIGKKTVRAGRMARNYVRQNPWKSTGFATGAGLVCGFLLFTLLRSKR